MSFALTDADLNGFNAEQKAALMESLLFAVLADGKVDPKIIERFDAETERIPWGMEAATLKSEMNDARTRITSMKTPADVTALQGSIAKRLTDSGIREKVFRAMTWIMDAGNLNPAEKTVMVSFATVFEISLERLAAIKSDLESA